jgi:hypothetical protein
MTPVNPTDECGALRQAAIVHARLLGRIVRS